MNRFLVLDEYQSVMSKHPTLAEATTECVRVSTDEDGDEYFVAEVIGRAGHAKSPIKYTVLRKAKK